MFTRRPRTNLSIQPEKTNRGLYKILLSTPVVVALAYFFTRFILVMKVDRKKSGKNDFPKSFAVDLYRLQVEGVQ